MKRLYNANPPNVPTGGAPPTGAPSPSTDKAITDRLNALESRNQSLETSLAEHKRANEELLLRLAAPAPTTQATVPTTPPADVKTKWWTDPQATFQEQVQPMVQSVMATNYYLMRNQMEARYQQEFKLWGKEIDDMLKELHPNYLMNPKTWEITIERIRGRHVQEFAKNPNLVSAYSEPATPGEPPPPPDPASALSAEELKMAARFKLTPQQYAARKATIKVAI